MSAPRRRPMPYARDESRDEPSSVVEAVEHVGDKLEQFSDKLNLPRWVGPLAVGSIIGFLPWIVYLGLTLPSKVRAQHYDIAWLGFDCALWTMLAVLAWAALRRHAATGPVAAMASMMLIVDAWFDIFTSSASHGEMALAITLAICGELPLAILCAWVAVHAERIRHRTYRTLRLHWERASRTADEAVTVTSRRISPRPR
jgi:hypothetical protein